MGLIRGLIGFLGRFFISIVFIASGIHQMMEWAETELAFSDALTRSMSLLSGGEKIQDIFKFAQESVSLLLGAAIFCQIIGGLCILLSVQVRFGAFLLIVFLGVATFLFHHFWLFQGAEREAELVEFMKNVGILGGLLILLAYGSCKKKCTNESSAPKDKE